VRDRKEYACIIGYSSASCYFSPYPKCNSKNSATEHELAYFSETDFGSLYFSPSCNPSFFSVMGDDTPLSPHHMPTNCKKSRQEEQILAEERE
jgi:hypothetical protein